MCETECPESAADALCVPADAHFEPVDAPDGKIERSILFYRTLDFFLSNVRFFSIERSKIFSGIFQIFLRHVPKFSPARSKFFSGTFKNFFRHVQKFLPARSKILAEYPENPPEHRFSQENVPFIMKKHSFEMKKRSFRSKKSTVLRPKTPSTVRKDAPLRCTKARCAAVTHGYDARYGCTRILGRFPRHLYTLAKRTRK
ncbi:hypothetical protein [Xylanibacter caecicola]|uniref:hypothetical protein n=1 Tax=Xylanibacter caecicola TaxID=2736294 RepID=UPI00258C5EA8|nr:hypothetical protein [Xylanibacter caecicola]